eukprot:662990-Hanusia_phi.AAC.2
MITESHRPSVCQAGRALLRPGSTPPSLTVALSSDCQPGPACQGPTTGSPCDSRGAHTQCRGTGESRY